MKIKSLLSVVALTSVVGLSACGSAHPVDSNGRFIGEPQMQDIYKDTFSKRGSEQRGIVMYDAADPRLKSLKIGLHKNALLSPTMFGKDHYNGGFGANANRWNVFFSSTNTHCQIVAGYNSKGIVNDIRALPEGCATVVEKEVPREVTQPNVPNVRKIELNAGAWFDFDKAVLKSQYAPELAQLAQIIRANAGAIEQIIVVGHTDQSGTESYNQALSEKRAQAVANYLTANGAPATVMHVVGLGESQPVKDCGNPDNPSEAIKACNYDNRRVEIYVKGVLAG